MTQKAFNQFDAFTTILKGEELSQQDKEKINSYLLLRWLSGDRRVLPAANTVNQYYNIPAKAQYDLFRGMLHGKLKFIRYPKGASQKTNNDIELISKHYNVSFDKAHEMLEFISKKELKELQEIYV